MKSHKRSGEKKVKTIKLEDVAKQYVNPQMFMDDCAELSAKIRVHFLKYGYMGWRVVVQTLENL